MTGFMDCSLRERRLPVEFALHLSMSLTACVRPFGLGLVPARRAARSIHWLHAALPPGCCIALW